MPRRIDYSLQLSDIEAPSQGKAGELLVQAGATAGEAAAIGGKAKATESAATAGLISFLGTTAVEAYKGKMEADLEKDIASSLSKLEGAGPTAVASKANLDRLRSPEFASNIADQLTVLTEQSGMEEPQLVAGFMEDIKRYADAQRQGIMSRTEVLARVSAAVKEASSAMPGWAANFRKVGAELTGISNLDVYGIHHALTTKSLAEKAVEKKLEIELQLKKEIATEMGYASLDQITPAAYAAHFEGKQLKLAAANTTAKMQLVQMVQEEADKVWGRAVAEEIGGAVADLKKDFAKLYALNANPQTVIESKEFGLQLSSKLALQYNALEQKIRAMTRPVAGGTALSVKEADRLIGELRPVYKNYEDAVKNIEGRNVFAALVKNSQDRVDLLVNNLMNANPHIAVLNKVGSMSELFKAWVSLGNEPEFEKRFGKELTNAMKAIMKNPAAHANVFGTIASGGAVDLAQVNMVSPDLAKVTAAGLVVDIKEWSRDTAPTEQRKNAYSNVFATASRTLNMNVPRDLDAAYSILTAPETQAFLKKLSPLQQANALGPVVANAEATTRNVVAQIQSEIAAFNDSSGSVAVRAGWRLKLARNALTGAFEVVPEKSGPQLVQGVGGSESPALMGADAAAARKRAEGLASNLNKMLEVYTVGQGLLAPGASVNLEDVKKKVEENMRSGANAPLSVALGLRSTDVPRSNEATASLQFDKEKVLDAIVKAEGSGDSAVSKKGARGRYQIMPETAKQYGLKVEPQAGIDERTDPAKSRLAMGKYVTALMKMFEGDLEKVAAAYNAGQGNVRKAIERATDLGIADQWKAFLPKPGETIPYIKKFMAEHGIPQ